MSVHRGLVMPFVGLGLHFLVAIYFAVHALRSGQGLYWLFILFSFPILGSVVYFLVIYLPNSRLESDARKAMASAAKILDPGRELREAQAAFEYTPSAQNQMRLAAALLNAGQAAEAAQHYQACLQGALAADPDIQLGAARAQVACGQFDVAIARLRALRDSRPDFRSEELALLLAQALASAGHKHEVLREYEAAMARFGSFQSKAECFLWAVAAGERELAGRLQIELQKTTDRWNRHTRQLNADLLRRLNAGYAMIRQSAT